jgi:hypothetical protein
MYIVYNIPFINKCCKVVLLRVTAEVHGKNVHNLAFSVKKFGENSLKTNLQASKI